MGIELVDGARVLFPATANVSAPTSRTWTAWIKITDINAGGYHVIFEGYIWTISYVDSDVGPYLNFLSNWTGASNGRWTGVASLSNDVWYHVAMSYNESSSSNNPVFYLNGSPVGVSEVVTPIGSVADDDGWPISLGDATDERSRLIIKDARIYNRILTADEVLDIYNSKSYDSVPRGLVFQMRGYGCAGGQTYEGMTLGTANKVVDYVGGAIGTPYGNPIGRGDNLLSCNP